MEDEGSIQEKLNRNPPDKPKNSFFPIAKTSPRRYIASTINWLTEVESFDLLSYSNE